MPLHKEKQAFRPGEELRRIHQNLRAKLRENKDP